MKKWLIILSTVFFTLTATAEIKPLPANQVFHHSVALVDPNTLSLNWNIEPGYFLYADRLYLCSTKKANLEIGPLRFPPAIKKTNPLGQVNRIYRNALELSVPILGQHPGKAILTLAFQGCSDEGFCYPPEKFQIEATIDEQLALTHVEFLSNTPTAKVHSIDQNDQIQAIFRSNYWSVILLSFFGLGLLLAFTPCVLPMIPVLSGIIVGHGPISTRKAFGLSLSYVFSMACTYAGLGVIAASLGKNLQIAMQSPIVIGLFSGVFVLLALSMFGLYDLKLPVSWQARLAQRNKMQASGHYLSAAAMGCLSSLVLSPCVTPPLVGALGYIAKSGNVWLGGWALFFLGFGMGAPLLLIGTSAGQWLPKAGYWMNAVKSFFGFLMLGVAIYLINRIIPPAFTMALWGALLVFAGIYCDAFVSGDSHRAKVKQACGMIILVYGLVLLLGASMGSTSFIEPLAGAFVTGQPRAVPSTITVVTTSDELHQAIQDAHDMPVLLDFYADWCTSCKILEHSLFDDPGIKQTLQQFKIIKVDITDNSSAQQALLNEYQVIAPPTFIFLNKQGDELANMRLVGEVSKANFMQQLDAVKELS